jgi:hypothetical protein
MYSGGSYPGFSSGGYPSYSNYPSAMSDYNSYYNSMGTSGSGCSGSSCGQAAPAPAPVELIAAPEPSKPEVAVVPEAPIDFMFENNFEDNLLMQELEEQQKKEELDWLWIELLAQKIKENMKKQQPSQDGISGKRNFRVCPAVDDLMNPIQMAHADDCHKFYVCSMGTPVEIECPNNLAYDNETERCVASDSCN